MQVGWSRLSSLTSLWVHWVWINRPELGWDNCNGSILLASHPLPGTSGQKPTQVLLMVVREVQDASSHVPAPGKPLVASHMLPFHWLNGITGSNPKSKGSPTALMGGTTKVRVKECEELRPLILFTNGHHPT